MLSLSSMNLILELKEFEAREVGETAGKTPVFGLLKRDGRVFVEIVKNCTREQLMSIIQGKILEGSAINTGGWKAYDSLILNIILITGLFILQ